MTSAHAEGIARARQLLREGRPEAAAEAIGELLRAAPEDPDLLAALGGVCRAAGLLDEAEAAYRSALGRRPNAVAAAVGLAEVMIAKGDPDPAIRILSRIHQLAPQLAPAAMALATALLAAGRPDDALALYDQLLAQSPDLAQAHANRAETLARLGRYRDSLAAAETAHRLAPADPRIALNRAFALLLEGRVEDGLAAYEARLDPAHPNAPVRDGLHLPRWSGAHPPDGPLLVAAEQGLGDEIRFGALAWRMAGDGIPLMVEAEPRLVPLLRRSLPDASVHSQDRRRSGVKPVFRYDWLAGTSPRPVAWIDAGSLPFRLGLPSVGSVAPRGYLRPDPRRVAAFTEWLAPLRSTGPVVGIVWGSSRRDAGRSRFYPPLDAWKPVLTLPGVRFVDLQYVDADEDRRAFRETMGVDILPVDILDKRNDLDGGAALAAALDAVVGVSSSVAALAGAVGTPTIEVAGERVWLPKSGGRDAILGPIRLVEAGTPGDWGDAMRQAAALLRQTPGHG